MQHYMNDSDISLNVMKDTIGSNVICTSMATGLAMVVSDVGSIRDYCDETNACFCSSPDDFIEKIIQQIVVKKHLCGEELASCIHFLFQMVEIFKNRCCFRVSFRVACTTDTEIPLCFNICDQFTCVLVLIRQRKICICRNIATECKDILDICCL